MIDSLKELEKLIKLCRKNGITGIEVHGVKFNLGELPERKRRGKVFEPLREADDPYKNFPSGELTPEQLMFYSSGGVPENDPEAKVG